MDSEARCLILTSLCADAISIHISRANAIMRKGVSITGRTNLSKTGLVRRGQIGLISAVKE